MNSVTTDINFAPFKQEDGVHSNTSRCKAPKILIPNKQV